MTSRWAVYARMGVVASVALGCYITASGAGADAISGSSRPQASISAQPSLLAFGSQLVNTRSGTRQVTVTAQRATSIRSAQTGSASFLVVQNKCAGLTLHANSSCVITIAFAPIAAGALTDTMTITDSKSTALTSVALSGTGVSSDWEQLQGGPQHAGQAPGAGPASGLPATVWSSTPSVPAGRTAHFGAALVSPNGNVVVVKTSDADPNCGSGGASTDDAEIDTFSRSGQPIWNRFYNCDDISSLAVAPSGTLVALDSNGLFVLDAQGTQVWNRSIPASRGGGLTIAPDGTVYLQAAGTVTAVSATGVVVWTVTPPYAGGSDANSAPTLSPDGSTVYVAGAGGVLTALSKSDVLLWQLTLTDQSAPATIPSSPSVGADGTIYLASAGGTLTAISPAGSIVWTRTDPNGGFGTSPSLAGNGQIVIGDLAGYLNAFQADNGTLLWTRQDLPFGPGTPQPIVAPVLLDSSGNVFTQNANFTGAYTPAGELIWDITTLAGASPLALDSSTGTLYVVRTSVSGPELDAIR